MLTLSILLGLMSDNFCMLRAEGVDTVKSTVISLTYVQDQYGGEQVRRVVRETPGLSALALGVAATKCPQFL
jgi:hypothetical protein